MMTFLSWPAGRVTIQRFVMDVLEPKIGHSVGDENEGK